MNNNTEEKKATPTNKSNRKEVFFDKQIESIKIINLFEEHKSFSFSIFTSNLYQLHEKNFLRFFFFFFANERNILNNHLCVDNVGRLK